MTPERPPENACLFLDVDGTLIDLAPTPESVIVPDGLVGDLARAERVFDGALALVSGRNIADLDRLFTPLSLKASGVHGAEFRMSSDAAGQWSAAKPLPDGAWTSLGVLLDAFPGTLAENKHYSYAVHYRAAPDRGPEVRAALVRFIGEHGDLGLQIMPGHYVYELKPPDVDKGAAIRNFMDHAPFAGRMPVFIGDDVTDAPGFTMVKALGGRGYSVRQAFPDVAGTFSDPAAVRRWLSEIQPREALTA